jgi:hypothetical protein
MARSVALLLALAAVQAGAAAAGPNPAPGCDDLVATTRTILGDIVWPSSAQIALDYVFGGVLPAYFHP